MKARTVHQAVSECLASC